MDNNQNQRNGNNNPLGGGGNNSPRRQNLILLLVAALVTMFCMTYFLRAFSENTNSEVTYSEFIQKVEAGEIEKIVIEEDRINIYPKETKAEDQLGFGYSLTGYTTVTYYTGKAEEDSVLTQRMLDAGVEVSSEVPDSSGAILTFLLYYIAPILLMWLLLSIIFKRMGRGGGPLSVGKSNAKVYVQKETGVTFKDVAGEDEAKESLVEVVDFL